MEQNHVYIHEDCRAMVQLFQPPKPRTKNLWDLFESYWIPLVHRASFAATHTTNPSAYHQPERTPRRGVGCTWHMGRGSRTYLDPFALQGSNRVQPSLSYTNLTSDVRPRTLRVIFFVFVLKNSGIFKFFGIWRKWSFHLRGFKKRIPSHSNALG